MDRKKLREILHKVKSGKISLESAMESLAHFPYSELGFAVLDTHREIRQGAPEVIMAQGKKIPQLREIIKRMRSLNQNILLTRLDEETYRKLKKDLKGFRYNALARTAAFVQREVSPKRDSYICIVSAGTSDIPVAEEAAETALFLGSVVRKIYDVGVAGIHRLFSRIEEIRSASAVIVVAGMEGALPSVVGGLIPKPVIAVPTSTGYGASFGGLSALLGILNSCAPNVVVVNIDNGFGAGFVASLIERGM